MSFKLGVLAIALTLATNSGFASRLPAQNNSPQRSPSDVVREFYKAMREKRYREAFALTIYNSAFQALSADEIEDMRPLWEEKSSEIPDPIEIAGEQISGNSATVFIKLPATESSPQVVSQPLNLISSSGGWIIGTEADQLEVKKAGRRYFLDALIAEHEGDVEEVLKRLVVIEGIYRQQHNGVYADFPALVSSNLISNDAIDPRLSGYNFHVTLAKDAKTYFATAEPTRHGHTGKLSFWMDQTGLIKSADNGGKPLKP